MKKNELQPEPKNHLIAYLMWGLGFVGISGMHRLYLGQYGRGVALILTFGGCGVWQLIDVATINERIALLNGDQTADNGKAKTAQQENHVKTTIQQQNRTKPEKATQPIEINEFDDLEAEQAELQKRLEKFKD